jgi:hypothetical protein
LPFKLVYSFEEESPSDWRMRCLYYTLSLLR